MKNLACLSTVFLFNCSQDLAIKTADANGSTVILATDPDADRLALAEKQPEYVHNITTDRTLDNGHKLEHALQSRISLYIIIK